jgi:predicted kinase
MDAVAATAARYADAGYFTIVDGIIIPRWFLGPIREALDAAGHSAAYAVLRAPLATCLARVAAREPHVHPAVVEQLWSEFDDLGELERHAVAAESTSEDALADAIYERLRAGDLTLRGPFPA